MLIERKEIMKTQKFVQRKHIQEMDKWQRSQVAVIDNISREFENEIKQITLKFAQLENKLENKLDSNFINCVTSDTHHVLCN